MSAPTRRSRRGLTEAQVLTHLLRLSGLSPDVCPELSHSLLDQFHTLDRLMSSPADVIMKVPGMDDQTTAFLLLFPAVLERHYNSPDAPPIPVHTREDALDLLLPRFQERDSEMLYALCLGEEHQLLTCGVAALGGQSRVGFDTTRLLNMAVSRPTAGVIIAHCHPDGDASFSDADRESTLLLAQRLDLVEIALLDHFLIVGNQVLSLREEYEAHPGTPSPFRDILPHK